MTDNHKKSKLVTIYSLDTEKTKFDAQIFEEINLRRLIGILREFANALERLKQEGEPLYD